MIRFVVLVDGRFSTAEERLSLDEAAGLVAKAYAERRKVEARVSLGGTWRVPTKKETEALATLAAAKVREEER